MEEYKQGKGGRPRKYYATHKGRDPQRRKMRELADLSGWTPEQKEERRKELAKQYTEKVRLKHLKQKDIRESTKTLKTLKERKEFRAYINKLNKERLDAILSDKELMWQIFGDRIDLTTEELEEIREKKKDNREYITDEEVQRVMGEIYGGYAPQIIEEEGEYQNPYGELPE